MRYIVMKVLASLGLVYFLVGAAVYVFQAGLIYFPERETVSTPRHAGLPYEEIVLVTEDRVALQAWFVAVPHARAVLLFCHGNAGNISHCIESVALFARLGLNVLIFDYRGYGRSEGRPTEKGTYLDARAAWRYLVQERGVAPQEIILFGRSLGAAVASWLAVVERPGALILESAFTSIPDMAARLYPFLPVNVLSRFKYNTLGNVQRVKCPVLVVHSLEDEIVPFTHGRRLYTSAREPKKFLELKGDHNSGFLISRSLYLEGVSDFITASLKR